MILDDLIKKLQELRCDEEAGKREVSIPVQGRSLGWTPNVSVIDVYSGIDWDANRIFIRPDQKLVRISG
jgi:hypothetical protein